METPMKGNSSLARLCFDTTTSTTTAAAPTSSSTNTSPSTIQKPGTASSSPQTALTNNTNNNNNNKLSGLFPGPNCKCLVASHVALFLDERSLISLMRTCKRLREITASDEVWDNRLKDMRVNLILVNRTANFFRAFRSDIVTLRGLEGFYDFESDETGASSFNAFGNEFTNSAPVTAIKKVMLTVSPAFLGFVTPVARVCLVVQYFGLAQEDVFEGTVRYSFPKRLFVMSTYLTRAPRQEGPKFDIVIARSARKWGTQKISHFDKVKGGTRLILSISQAAQNPSNGYLPSSELLTVSRIPRDGEGSVPPLPDSAVGAGILGNTNNSSLVHGSGANGGSSVKNDSNLSTGSLREMDSKDSNSSSNNSSSPSSGNNSNNSSKNSSPANSEKRFSLRSLLGGMKS